MPCQLTIHDLQNKTTAVHLCDEDNTSRLVEDDYNASGAAEYTDTLGRPFTVDWTQSRLIGFVRKRDDGAVIASGGADGAQTEVS